jgi:hypothetical protein
MGAGSACAVRVRAGEVADAVLGAVVLATLRVIPFDAEPGASGAGDGAVEADGAAVVLVPHPVTIARALVVEIHA